MEGLFNLLIFLRTAPEVPRELFTNTFLNMSLYPYDNNHLNLYLPLYILKIFIGLVGIIFARVLKRRNTLIILCSFIVLLGYYCIFISNGIGIEGSTTPDFPIYVLLTCMCYSSFIICIIIFQSARLFFFTYKST